jgi:hypothetical protein
MAVAAAPPKFVRYLHRDIPERTLVRDLRRVARRTGCRVVTADVYRQHGAFGASTLISRFGSWNAAVEAAGLGVTRRWKVPNEVLLRNIAEVWRMLGRQPAFAELTKGDGVSKFAAGTYRRRFGSWRDALRAFETFVRTGGLGAVTLPDQPPVRPRPPRKVGFRLRATVLIRDSCLCRMCGASPAKDPGVTLHVDHIVPWSKGGETMLSNLQTLCAMCNIGKGDQHRAARRSRTNKRPLIPAALRRP